MEKYLLALVVFLGAISVAHADGLQPAPCSPGTGTGVCVGQTSASLITPSANSLTITGTAGAGFVELSPQSVVPSSPAANTLRLYSTSGGFLGVAQNSGFVGRLSFTALTTSRTFAFPDLAGPIAVAGNNLSVFAATTSAQLAGVISDETGSGSLVFATAPALTGPTTDTLVASGLVSVGTIKAVGTIPVVTGTGSPTILTGSTDTAGEVTGGTLATSIIITFSSAKSNSPICVVTSQTTLAAFAYTASTTAITITLTATTGEVVDYHCFQR